MYLKEIKAHGFKSFADNITIELNQGITGIVGPNGSGKSNVVDAVRWVMGEQSVKSLRGDNSMTDIIFSGSKSRKALNIASVTLVFDNSDKYLPLDFTEVSIKRSVYADGTNEYYLNGEKCRLKDIFDVLMDSGVEKESFNIISQGKIEEIISNKPEDRRIIFEEAAGVLKYKKRKEEALRKLDRTHNNMERINDIIGELEVQVEPLKEQKEQALKYQELNNELKDLEVALITSDITKINNTYQSNKKEVETLNNELIKLATTNSGNEAKSMSFKKELSDLNFSISETSQNLINKNREVEQLNSQKQIILERQKYQVDDAKLHENIVFLTEKSHEYENKLNSLRLDKENKQADLNKLYNQVTINEQDIKELRLERQKLETSLTSAVRMRNLNNNKILDLREEIDSNSALPYAVRQVLNNPKLQGIYNTIGGVIEVDSKYVLAITTSLGLSTNFIITKNSDSAKEAINYLKNNNIGRATFFPLDVIKPKAIEDDVLALASHQQGYINVASNLVKCENIYSNIIKNQLGNVIVCDNLDNANSLSRKINKRYKIVTIDGNVIHVGGSLTGGNAVKNHSVINDKYELENLLNKNKELDSDISILEDKINVLDNKLKSLEDSSYVVNKDKINLENIIKELDFNIVSITNSLEETKASLEGTKHIVDNTLSNEEERVINAYYQKVKERDEVNNLLINLNKKRDTLNASLEEYEASIKSSNSIYKEKSERLKNLEIEVNRADVKLDNLLNTLNEVYALTYEKAKENYILEIEDNIARSKVNSLKREIKDLGVVNIGAIEEYERVNTRYSFLTKQKEDLVNAENMLLEIINEMDSIMISEFAKTFEIVNNHFKETFRELFKGGSASLKLTDPNNLLETGIEIIASPPGKKLTSINLLSGGEKTFTAISLLFAILKSRPVPFCILDEVEAALDEVNVASFGEYLLKLKDKTQFILITHKKKTMEYVDILYGITMQESGVSKLVSVKLEEMNE